LSCRHHNHLFVFSVSSFLWDLLLSIHSELISSLCLLLFVCSSRFLWHQLFLWRTN
jgi:hypothetical protein